MNATVGALAWVSARSSSPPSQCFGERDPVSTTPPPRGGDAGLGERPVVDRWPRPLARILVLLDGTSASLCAVRRAAEIAQDRHATLDVLAIARPRRALLAVGFAFGLGIPPDRLEEDQLLELSRLLHQAVADLPGDVGVRTILRLGEPQSVCAELIGDVAYDLVVLAAPPFARERRAIPRCLLHEVDLLVVQPSR